MQRLGDFFIFKKNKVFSSLILFDVSYQVKSPPVHQVTSHDVMMCDDRDEWFAQSSTHNTGSDGGAFKMQLNLPQRLQMFKLTLPDTVIAWGAKVSLNNGQLCREK